MSDDKKVTPLILPNHVKEDQQRKEAERIANIVKCIVPHTLKTTEIQLIEIPFDGTQHTAPSPVEVREFAGEPTIFILQAAEGEGMDKIAAVTIYCVHNTHPIPKGTVYLGTAVVHGRVFHYFA